MKGLCKDDDDEEEGGGHLYLLLCFTLTRPLNRRLLHSVWVLCL